MTLYPLEFMPDKHFAFDAGQGLAGAFLQFTAKWLSLNSVNGNVQAGNTADLLFSAQLFKGGAALSAARNTYDKTFFSDQPYSCLYVRQRVSF